MKCGRLWLCLLLFLPACRAFSSAALLLEEPFAKFGWINPTGHAAIYLSRVCAATPIKLRRCGPGEYGVVLSRYRRVGGYDWLAIPLIPYLYAVDSVDQVPDSASPEIEASLRDAWRRKHLSAIVPDTKDGQAPRGDRIQLLGSLYDRKIFAFEVDTTEQQDDALIRRLNRRRNHTHFNLLFDNCADFSRGILNFYYPHAVRRSYSADLGMTTPKQVAKGLARYSARHERAGMEQFVLPQVSGSIPRSRRVDGVLESMLRKKYVIPIAVLHPYVAAAIFVSYLGGGRFDPSKGAVPLDQAHVVPSLWKNEPPLLDASTPLSSPVSDSLGQGLGDWGSGFIRPFTPFSLLP